MKHALKTSRQMLEEQLEIAAKTDVSLHLQLSEEVARSTESTYKLQKNSTHSSTTHI